MPVYAPKYLVGYLKITYRLRYLLFFIGSIANADMVAHPLGLSIGMLLFLLAFGGLFAVFFCFNTYIPYGNNHATPFFIYFIHYQENFTKHCI